MRNNKIKHFFVDACAGSGIVQSQNNAIVDGSPLLMAKTRQVVEQRIRDKTRQPSVECKFIEVNPKTFRHLRNSLSAYRDFSEPINADANDILTNILDKLNGFTFVYIDPFGLGKPVIKYETIKHVLERRFTELFLHFSWEGVSRTAGLLTNIDHHDTTLKQQARSAIDTLNLFMGGDQWQEIWNRKMEPSLKRKSILDLYLNGLRAYYDFPTPIEIPLSSRNPDFYLVFTTRNETGNKIMTQIVDKKRRKGTAKLEDFFK
jgi:three-Cys-motif partner protein